MKNNSCLLVSLLLCLSNLLMIPSIGVCGVSYKVGSDTTNVKRFGAKGDGITDDSKALQEGINFARLHNTILFIPAGVYIVSKTNFKGKPFCLLLEGNNHIAGAGAQSIIRLQANQENFARMFQAIDNAVRDITIDNISLDGNYLNNMKPPNPQNKPLPFEQNGLLFLDGTSNVVIRNCSFLNACGDGITIRGSSRAPDSILIFDNSFMKCQREGIGLGSGYRNVSIIGCYFEDMDDDCIHSEPSSGIIENVYIGGNFFVYTKRCGAITTCGWNENNPGKNYVIELNYQQNGSINFTRSKQVVFYNNMINNVLVPRNPTIYAAYTVNDITVSNNIIKQNGGACFYMATVGARQISDIMIRDNLLIAISPNQEYIGKFSGINNLTIVSNHLLTDKVNIGIHLQASSSISKDTIRNNFIENAKEGVRFSSVKEEYKIVDCAIVGNNAKGAVTPLNVLISKKVLLATGSNMQRNTAPEDFLVRISKNPVLSGVRNTSYYLQPLANSQGNIVDLGKLLNAGGNPKKDFFLTGDILIKDQQQNGAGRIKFFVKLKFDYKQGGYKIDKEREGAVLMNAGIDKYNLGTSCILKDNKLIFSIKGNSSSVYNIASVNSTYFSL
ncbi:Pectate lyase superfamily protein [Chitinophaga sp. CF118]|uniref:right-handed parallel beta-helix repeat-containing protein n=1 Tax=Chitinophaga sp. CF118 TaxID=1884367 RepID=UPI0008E840B5|nr:right-handed parallel beta-helix repeat-containing protein [Chitinophaga sp. CF118]SFD80784.1 Pectate lyase superfamily protein [Chitinophaga sp. CF118]